MLVAERTSVSGEGVQATFTDSPQVQAGLVCPAFCRRWVRVVSAVLGAVFTGVCGTLCPLRCPLYRAELQTDRTVSGSVGVVRHTVARQPRVRTGFLQTALGWSPIRIIIGDCCISHIAAAPPGWSEKCVKNACTFSRAVRVLLRWVKLFFHGILWAFFLGSDCGTCLLIRLCGVSAMAGWRWF